MNLGQGKVGMLKVDFLRAPSMCQFVLDDFDYLDVGARKPGDAASVDFDLGRPNGCHDD